MEETEFIVWLDEMDSSMIVGAKIVGVYENMGDLHIILDNGT